MRSHMLRLYESFAVVAPLPACLQVTNLASIPVAAYFGCSLSVYIVKQPRRDSTSVGAPVPPSALARDVVSQAWDEVGLAVTAAAAAGEDKGAEEDYNESMFSRGADLVTTMLLSRCFQRRGHSVGMQDLIDHPTQESQASLLEARNKEGMNGTAERSED
ncbi:MAG: hypothetical protein LQ348_002809 [Seirophora lacunosa]|nr:MAG: hypothetical protein LQ348_002809 [Seirophora lacunosa]